MGEVVGDERFGELDRDEEGSKRSPEFRIKTDLNQFQEKSPKLRKSKKSPIPQAETNIYCAMASKTNSKGKEKPSKIKLRIKSENTMSISSNKSNKVGRNNLNQMTTKPANLGKTELN